MSAKIKRLKQKVENAEVDFTRARIHWARANATAFIAEEKMRRAEIAERQAKIDWAVAVALEV